MGQRKRKAPKRLDPSFKSKTDVHPQPQRGDDVLVEVSDHCLSPKWQPARILAKLAPPKPRVPPRYEVHYLGWGTEYDEVVPAQRVKPLSSTNVAICQKLAEQVRELEIKGEHPIPSGWVSNKNYPSAG
jgi:hypothetical protein